jgi:hypothetical protein
MNRLFRSLAFCLLVVAVAGLSGCGKTAATDGNKAFQSASPDLKKSWDMAMAAMKTNGYAAAILHLQELRAQPGLSAEQTKAVEETSTAISDKMYDAANDGDPAAKQAIEDLRSASGR